MVEYPSGFVGPLRPGDTRADAPREFAGPVRPGTDEAEFRRTGRSVSSGGSRRSPTVSTGPSAAEKATEQKRIADQKAAELKARQDAAVKAARQRVADIQAKRTAADISRVKQDIKSRGGTTTTRTAGAGKLEITTTKKGSRKVREVKDLRTGEVRITEFGTGKGGGSSRVKRGVVITESTPVVGAEVKVDRSQLQTITTGEVQPVTTSFFGRVADLPSKAIEKVTGKKPREVFRFLTGSQEADITKPVTISEAVVETTTVPMKAVSIIAAGAGAGAEAIAEKVAPRGVSVVFGETEARQVSFLEPQFGTVTQESQAGVIERTVTIPKRGERTVQIFTPERVGTGVKVGTALGATIVAPTVFAPGFVAEGTQTALDPTKTPGERALGGLEAATGAFIIGSKVVKIARTPVVTRTPTRPIKTPQAIEIQKTVQVAGKPTTVSVFEIRGEISPPVLVTRTTKGRQVLDFVGRQAEKVVRVGDDPVISLRARPTIEKVIPAKTFSIRTPEPVIGKGSFLVSEVQAGRRAATISRITGTDTTISLKEFKQLSKLEKFALQRRAEQLVGRKVSLENVPKILSSSKQRVSSFIESEKLLKVKPGPRVSEFELIPEGRRVTRAIGVTEAERVVKTDAIDLIKAQTTFKDITFPGARAAGRTPTLETTIVKIKPISSVEKFKFTPPADIKKTPLSKTFQLQEPVTESLAAQVPLPTPKPVAPTTTILEPAITPVARTFPAIVGGAGGQQAESVFAGTGQFEITAPQITSVLRPSARQSQPQVKAIQLQPQVEVSKQVQRPGQIELIKQIEVQKSIQQPKQIEIVKQLEAQKSIEVTKQVSLQKELLGLQSSQLFRPSPTTTTITPTPSIIILPPTGDTPAQKAVKQLSKGMKGDFEVFARIGGEDVSIGKASTKKKAAKILSKKLKKTLAASGFLEEDGRRLSAAETGLVNGDFRVGRLDVSRVVQKKTARLGTGQETSQIQFFRASKKGGGNLFGSSSGGRKNSNFF